MPNAVLKNDAIRRQVLLEMVKTNEANKFLTFIKSLEKSIRERLQKEGATIETKKRLTILLNDLTKIQNEAYKKFNGDLTTSLESIAIDSAELESSALDKIAKGFETVLPANKQIIEAFKGNPLSVRGKSQGLTLEPFLKQFTDDQVNLINGKIAQGFAEGQTNDQILTALRGTKELRFKDGVFETVNRNAKTIVRTAIQNAANSARQEVWSDNSDIITGVEWVSTLDSHTTEECQALDGQIFPVDSGPRPPAHYGCRSTTAPVLADDLKVLQTGGQRPSKGENKAGDLVTKKVSANTTYFEWIKTQPDSFTEKVLGVNRSQLLKSGELTVSQFRDLQLNSNFQPMTLAEMKITAKETLGKDILPNIKTN